MSVATYVPDDETVDLSNKELLSSSHCTCIESTLEIPKITVLLTVSPRSFPDEPSQTIWRYDIKAVSDAFCHSDEFVVKSARSSAQRLADKLFQPSYWDFTSTKVSIVRRDSSHFGQASTSSTQKSLSDFTHLSGSDSPPSPPLTQGAPTLTTRSSSVSPHQTSPTHGLGLTSTPGTSPAASTSSYSPQGQQQPVSTTAKIPSALCLSPSSSVHDPERIPASPSPAPLQPPYLSQRPLPAPTAASSLPPSLCETPRTSGTETMSPLPSPPALPKPRPNKRKSVGDPRGLQSKRSRRESEEIAREVGALFDIVKSGAANAHALSIEADWTRNLEELRPIRGSSLESLPAKYESYSTASGVRAFQASFLCACALVAQVSTPQQGRGFKSSDGLSKTRRRRLRMWGASILRLVNALAQEEGILALNVVTAFAVAETKYSENWNYLKVCSLQRLNEVIDSLSRRLLAFHPKTVEKDWRKISSTYRLNPAVELADVTLSSYEDMARNLDMHKAFHGTGLEVSTPSLHSDEGYASMLSAESMDLPCPDMSNHVENWFAMLNTREPEYAEGGNSEPAASWEYQTEISQATTTLESPSTVWQIGGNPFICLGTALDFPFNGT